MNVKQFADTLGVLAAAAVVVDQAVELLAPKLRAMPIKAPAFLPAVVREIPERCANAFSAFTTSPSEAAMASRSAAPSGGGNAANGRSTTRPRVVPVNDRLTDQRRARASA